MGLPCLVQLTEPLNPDQHLDTANAATLCGLTPSYLKQLRVRGDGPRFVKFAERAVRYRVGDLLAWAGAHKVSSTSELASA